MQTRLRCIKIFFQSRLFLRALSQGFTVKGFKLDSAAPRGISCSFARNPETTVRQTRFPCGFVCIFTVNPRTFMQGGATRCMGVYCESAPNAGILHPANCGQTWRQPGFKKFSDYPGKQCRWGLRPVLPCRFPSGPPEASVPHCAWHRILRQAESCCGYRRLPGQRKSGH